MSLLTRFRTLRGLRPAHEPELPEVARSVAIIMDGNSRWARRRRLPTAAGHRAGTRALRRTVEAAIDLGVESLAVYAFSTENWSRPRAARAPGADGRARGGDGREQPARALDRLRLRRPRRDRGGGAADRRVG